MSIKYFDSFGRYDPRLSEKIRQHRKLNPVIKQKSLTHAERWALIQTEYQNYLKQHPLNI